MGIEDGTTEFYLSRPIEYKSGGGSEHTSLIVLKEPCMDHVKHYLKLKSLIMRAQMELAKQAGEINKLRDSIGDVVKPITEEAEALEAQTDEMDEAISLSLQAADNVDIGEFIKTFEAMACLKGRKSICMIDGKQAMTTALWANLKPDDAFKMAVRWCAFFGMPSVGGAKTTSGQQSESAIQRTAV